jgi:hypothetical protein
MNNLYQTFTEARLQFDAQRQEQIELARQALELKIAQRDFIKAAGDIKSALEKLAADKPAPMPPKPATAAPEAKAAVPARKAITKSPTAKPAAPKTTPKRPTRTLAEVEATLAALSQRVAALGSHLSK